MDTPTDYILYQFGARPLGTKFPNLWANQRQKVYRQVRYSLRKAESRSWCKELVNEAVVCKFHGSCEQPRWIYDCIATLPAV